MLPMNKRQTLFRRVAVIASASGTAGRDYLTGIFRYVNARKRWSLEIFNSTAEFNQQLGNHNLPDGIITMVPHEDRALEALFTTRVPTVIVDFPPSDLRLHDNRVSFVRLDDEAIGSAAAEHFLSVGKFNSFVCVIDQPDFQYPSCREQSFRSRLAGTGLFIKTFVLPEFKTSKRDIESFQLSFSRLPRPLAVFSVRDRATLKVYDACRRFNLKVPDEVAILGVDNDELFCTTLPVPLSSILPDHERVGYLAARELDHLLNGRECVNSVMGKSIKDIVVRASTRIIPPTARIVSSALSYIEKNVSGTLRVSDVVTHLGVSRRLADLRFRQIRNETILDAIIRARIGKIKKRLISTADSIGRIARDCGFSSTPALTRFFKTHTGATPLEWRNRSSR